MRHRIVAPDPRLLPCVGDAPVRGGPRDLPVRPGHAHEPGRQIAHVLLEPRRGVACRVHRDEHRPDAWPGGDHRLADDPDGRRAHICAVGVAEEHEHRATAKGRKGERPRVLVRQFERRGGRGRHQVGGGIHGRRRVRADGPRGRSTPRGRGTPRRPGRVLRRATSQETPGHAHDDQRDAGHAQQQHEPEAAIEDPRGFLPLRRGCRP